MTYNEMLRHPTLIAASKYTFAGCGRAFAGGRHNVPDSRGKEHPVCPACYDAIALGVKIVKAIDSVGEEKP